MTATATFNNTTSDSPATELSLVYRIITFQGLDFAVEEFNARYFLVTLMGSDMPGKLAAKTKPAIKAAIVAIYEDMTPEPQPTPPAAACEGYGATHWNLPTELQNAPAVAYIGMRHVCEHCKAQHDRALAHMMSLQGEATIIPVYEDIAVAAVADKPQENVIPVNKAKKPTAMQIRVLRVMADTGDSLIFSGPSVWWYDFDNKRTIYNRNLKVSIPTFSALRKNGWITDTDDYVPNHPGFYRYVITEAGRAALEGGK